ncbi:MAG: GNAT family N-acetyltransferase [Acidimicrobiia bacterium]|nr:GNAT family N-acetyltransferase [Acidimicrobiia bacterium]
MQIEARPASEADLPELIRLYYLLEAEQAELKSLWPVADGLAEPIAASFKEILDDPDSAIIVGLIDDVPLGFIWMRLEELLPQADGAQVGSVRLVFVQIEARGVGVGEAMIMTIMDDFRSRGVRLFDSHVSPGHRLAKNFFESNGFSARRIVMHHSEDERWQ